jgi:MFS transporter, DHA2 family, multidrug resistance protein
VNPLGPVRVYPPSGPDGRPLGPAPLGFRLVLGLVSILLGAFISNLDTRLTTFSLADLRGGIGVGVDEASWVSAAYNIAEIAVVPVTPWLATIISQRWATAGSVAVLTVAGALCPWAADRGYGWLVAMRFLQGLGGGALIPLLLGIFLRYLPLYQRVYGFALYALVTASTPLISETLAGVLTDIVGWQSVFYIGVAIGPLVFFLALFGLPIEPIKWEGFRTADYGGIGLTALWTSLLTAALFQGQRLDWFSSPLIVSLFVAAGCAFAAFLIQELTHAAPLINLRLLTRLNFSGGLVIVFVFAASTLMTSNVLPTYGTQVHGFREIQIGEILNWAALIQVAVCAVAPLLFRVFETRVVLAFALLVASIGARMATYIDSDWVRADILPSHLIQAAAQPLIMLSLVVTATATLQPTDALAGSTIFNTVRTLAGTVCGAIIGGIETVRERVHSNLLVDHLTAGAQGIADIPLPRLISTMQREAATMAAADAYGWIGIITLGAIALVLCLNETRLFRSPPRPVVEPLI